MTQATTDYLNRPLRSAEDMIDELVLEGMLLKALMRALELVMYEHSNISHDYSFLGNATAKAAKKEIGAVEAKIAELKERIATLRGTP